jgi:hypothetical protein
MAGKPKRQAQRVAAGLAPVEHPGNGSRPPFEVGNTIAVTHGSYSSVVVGPRAQEIADELRAVVPVRSPADEPSIRLLAQTLAQVERATAALERLHEAMGERPLGPYMVEDAAKLQRLREDTRGWINTARRLCGDLGLTPTSRARLGVDLARIEPSLVRRMQDEGRSRS